ncbi:hypothetical protein niasHT_012057 [Heterodera trifolii]|uniref:Uncharacterized protein n=1 Tax=Heterodera trifolii TaxID=157864 RepID=A0ABD2LA13_9BILA
MVVRTKWERAKVFVALKVTRFFAVIWNRGRQQPHPHTSPPPSSIGPPLWECVLKNACDPSKYGNAKPGRRFRLKKDCQTVEERIKEMPTEKIELLGNEFTDAQRIGPYFLEEFVPLAQ